MYRPGTEYSDKVPDVLSVRDSLKRTSVDVFASD